MEPDIRKSDGSMHFAEASDCRQLVGTSWSGAKRSALVAFRAGVGHMSKVRLWWKADTGVSGQIQQLPMRSLSLPHYKWPSWSRTRAVQSGAGTRGTAIALVQSRSTD